MLHRKMKAEKSNQHSNDKGNHTTFVTGHFKKRHQDN